LIYGPGDANVSGNASEGRQVFATKAAHRPIIIRTLRFCTLIGECAAGLMTETQQL
jgi:hypothetical protein